MPQSKMPKLHRSASLPEGQPNRSPADDFQLEKLELTSRDQRRRLSTPSMETTDGAKGLKEMTTNAA